mgnify:CR=1 FL=1
MVKTILWLPSITRIWLRHTISSLNLLLAPLKSVKFASVMWTSPVLTTARTVSTLYVSFTPFTLPDLTKQPVKIVTVLSRACQR